MGEYLLGLSKSVGSIHGLLVHCGVPVAVVEDHLCGCGVVALRS